MITLFLSSVAAAAQQSHAVILQYHHVSEDTPSSTSVSPERFAEHLAYISEHYTVLPLEKIINALQKHESVPENSIAITFDDGYRNILENAHPLLKHHGFAYTIFVNPALQGTRSNLLTWEELKLISQEGASIANHYLGHEHLLYKEKGKTDARWLKDHESNILLAEEIIESYIGTSPRYFAYPYGEYNTQIQALLRKHNIQGFAQHSGAISADSDFTALPRFPASGVYSNLNTLKVKMASLAFPVIKNSVTEPQLDASGKLENFTLKVDLSDIYASQVACYYKGNPQVLTWQENQVDIGIPEHFPTGRSRINCTAPSKSKLGHYYWFSQPFFVPTESGDWLN
ncbi:polysaccharide deacetylase family protein [Alteromonas sp. a30]|uniref:polysaccharide deacetylase family protein n=1 Tax=Alteromonas sp. a30 TaxID=2730917 RepID=UPI002281BFEB|nr:polysaccharide deacetylase family protein [Alteromonas sp. a30]MCY7295645.1 polysaccharide deacetylase family protein [Alteromonas sp. a30]